MTTEEKQPKLSGERLAWYELASHLGIPSVNELKERITISEFVEWQIYLRMETERHRKQDYYLAQIAAEIRRTFVAEPKKVRLQDFLLRFASAEEKSAAETKAIRTAKSKAAWFAAAGIKPEHN